MSEAPLLGDGEQISHDGCVRLMEAFWELLREDVEAGNPNARKWVCGPGFEYWASVCFTRVTPDEARDLLLERWATGIEGIRFA